MSWTGSIYKTAVGINMSMIFNDIWKLADQELLAPCGALKRPHRESPRPPINSYRQIIRFDDSMIIRFDDSMIRFDSMIIRFDDSMIRLFDASMLAAGLSLVLVAG